MGREEALALVKQAESVCTLQGTRKDGMGRDVIAGSRTFVERACSRGRFCFSSGSFVYPRCPVAVYCCSTEATIRLPGPYVYFCRREP